MNENLKIDHFIQFVDKLDTTIDEEDKKDYLLKSIKYQKNYQNLIIL